jgi:hypothetical protein
LQGALELQGQKALPLASFLPTGGGLRLGPRKQGKMLIKNSPLIKNEKGMLYTKEFIVPHFIFKSNLRVQSNKKVYNNTKIRLFLVKKGCFESFIQQNISHFVI